ncbi:MAG: hypothetical protein FWE21_08485 [Defluviitaleaceae bacterium]|nr:hypothetical protein [Defluviitaleaceae bacterium]
MKKRIISVALVLVLTFSFAINAGAGPIEKIPPKIIPNSACIELPEELCE